MKNLIRLIIFYISTAIYSGFPSPTLTEGVTGQPKSFLPSQAETQTDKTISHLLYKGLFKYDDNGTIVPDLAQKYTISKDGLVYTIKLKPHQKWSHGAEITSDDLIYTAFKLPEFSGVATDKVDKYTVRYTLPGPFSPFLEFFTTGIMPVNAEEKQNPLMPISNGDFQVISIKKDGPAIKQVVLRNKNKSAKFKKLIFRYYSNEKELLTSAKLREIDTFVLSQPQKINGFKLMKTPQTSVYYSLLFNLDSPEFEDEEFRLKLSQSLSVKELVQDLGIPVQGAISRNPYTNQRIKYDFYEPNLMPEFLDKEIEMIVPDIESQKDLALKISRVWEEKLGVTTKILPMDPNEIRESVVPARKFKILLYGQQVGIDPDRYINWHSSQIKYPGLNITGFNQVRADRALEEGRKTLGFDKRKVHYDDFQVTIMEHIPAIFLFHPYVNYYVSQSIENIPVKERFFYLWNRFDDFSSWDRRFLN